MPEEVNDQIEKEQEVPAQGDSNEELKSIQSQERDQDDFVKTPKGTLRNLVEAFEKVSQLFILLIRKQI